jgi:hypothetical protein
MTILTTILKTIGDFALWTIANRSIIYFNIVGKDIKLYLHNIFLLKRINFEETWWDQPIPNVTQQDFSNRLSKTYYKLIKIPLQPPPPPAPQKNEITTPLIYFGDDRKSFIPALAAHKIGWRPCLSVTWTSAPNDSNNCNTRTPVFRASPERHAPLPHIWAA